MATGDTLIRPQDDTPWWAPLVATGALLVVFLTGVAAGYGVGLADGENGERRRAIEAGGGRYVADPGTGKVEFVFGPGSPSPASVP